MAGQQGRSDPKEAALAATRCLNPHPEQVTDPAFLASEFFDARDAVQVKYEMVRKVKADGAPVTAAAAAFGYSRPAYYEAASALERSGLEGLVPARPGPRPAQGQASPAPRAGLLPRARARRRARSGAVPGPGRRPQAQGEATRRAGPARPAAEHRAPTGGPALANRSPGIVRSDEYP